MRRTVSMMATQFSSEYKLSNHIVGKIFLLLPNTASWNCFFFFNCCIRSPWRWQLQWQVFHATWNCSFLLRKPVFFTLLYLPSTLPMMINWRILYRSPMNMCPKYKIFLHFTVCSNKRVISALFCILSLVYTAVQGILIIRLCNHISKVSNLLIVATLVIQTAAPYSNTDHI